MAERLASNWCACVVAFLAAMLWPGALLGQSPAASPVVNPMLVLPRDRVPLAIDNNLTTTLPGNVQPGARPENDLGLVPGNLPMARMILALTRSSDQQTALDAFSAALQNPKSPYFHKWLTSETFGVHFGLSQNDLNRLSDWLKGLGFTIDDLPSGHWTITFSGTAAQVESAFHTSIHYYQEGGEVRYANATDPQIPQALAGIVSSVTGLNNFRPHHVRGLPTRSGVLANGQHFLDPSDFATIYNLNPLYSKGIDGSGVRIAVIEQCSMDVSLAVTFWSLEGLPQSSNFTQYYGIPSACTGQDIDEVYLDYEWSGAVAQGAQIVLVSANSLLAAVQGVVTNNLAPVVTMSYADCESAGDLIWVDLWQQAQTQGISGLVSSGDEGAAGCDAGTATIATHGRAVNGICSSPYVVCVGGTQFNDVSDPAQYWSATGHALGYIPEVAWNEESSSAAILGASGGGYSIFQSKPSWQTGNTTTQRGIPDVALTAASHDGYHICDSSSPCTSVPSFLVFGTSAAAPSFAGIMALVIQATGQNQGSPNQTLYGLAAQPSLGVFHDIVSGNNSVNGQQGYSAGPGWDPVTGLGSVDATALVTNWPDSSTGIPVVTNLEMTTVAPPPTGCAVPPAASTFLTTSNVAYLFFDATVTASDNLRTDFLAPNSDVLAGLSYSAAVGTFCFAGSQVSISNAPAAHLGQWQARIYDNGSQIASVSFTLNAPASTPVITSISPSSVIAGSGAFTLTVNGTGFTSSSTVGWNGSSLPTFFGSATQLTASVTGTLAAAAGTASITVSNAGVVSNTATITITASVPSNLSRIGVLPQVAAGAGWDTQIYLTNSTSGSFSVTLYYYADSGAPLSLPIAVTQQGRTQSLTTSALSAVIPPNTTLLVDTGFLSALVEGWADVHSNGSLTGFAVFRYAPQGLVSGPGVATPWEGTVPLQTQLSTSLMIVPFDNTNGFSTGVAVGDFSGAGSNLTATFYDENGNGLGLPQTISLAGNGHTSFLLNSTYPFTAGIVGVMKISGTGLMGLGLRASPSEPLPTVPFPIQ
jgi:pseudomonalisin